MPRHKNMSFLPEDYLQRRAARRTNILCIALFIIVMGGVVGGYLFTDWQRREVQAHQQRVAQQFEQAARRLEQLEQLQEQKQQMLHKARVTSALVERIPRSLLLSELINHMPTQLSLLELELETEVVRQTSQARTSLARRRERMKDEAKEKEQRVEVPETSMGLHLVGVAPTDVEVAQFMTALSRHPMFVDLNLQFSEETTVEQNKMRKFQIQMQVNQQVDLASMKPTRVKRGLKQDPMSETVQIDPPSEMISSGGDVQPASDNPNQANEQ